MYGIDNSLTINDYINYIININYVEYLHSLVLGFYSGVEKLFSNEDLTLLVLNTGCYRQSSLS